MTALRSVGEDVRVWDALLTAVYDAATHDGAWQRIAAKLATVLDSEHAVVWSVADGRVTDELSHTLPDWVHPAYRDYFHRIDPWFAFTSRRPAMKVWLSQEMMPARRFLQTEFCCDFSVAVGGVHVAQARFGIAPGRIGCVNIMRPRGARPFGERERHNVDRLVPHLQRALQIRHRLARSGAGEIGLAVLERLAFGALVCDGTKRVLFANAAAESLATGYPGLRLGGTRSRLAAASSAENARLTTLIRDAATGGPGGGLQIAAGSQVPLPMLVAPLPLRLSEGGRPGLVLVVFGRPPAQPAVAAADLGFMFGLTAAEARLAFALGCGKSLFDIMEERGVSESTVRTQLTRVLAKSGCRNQRELVRLLGSLPPLRA